MVLNHVKELLKKRYLTIKEVAKILGVTTQTLRNWDEEEKLKALRNPLNNYRIYKPEDIELFLRKIEAKGKIHLG